MIHERTSSRRRRVTGLATLALALVGMSLSTTPAHAAPGPTDVVQRFDANPATLGAIPDAVGGVPGVRAVDVPVGGVGSTPTDITLALSVSHSFVGDLSIRITAPDGATTVTVMDRPGVPATLAGDDSNLSGTYTFTEGAAGSFQGAATAATGVGSVVTPGTYAPAAADGTTPVSLAPLRSAPTVNGLWRVTVLDNGPADTGTVTALSLSFATLRSQSPACVSATATAAAAQASATQAAAAVAGATQALGQAKTHAATAKKKLKKAKKSSGAKAVKKARKKLRRARGAASGAQATLTSAQAASTTAQAALTSATAARTSSC